MYCVWQVVKTPTVILNNPVYKELSQENLFESNYLDYQWNDKGQHILGHYVGVVSESDCFRKPSTGKPRTAESCVLQRNSKLTSYMHTCLFL